MKYLDVSMVQLKIIDGDVNGNLKHTSKLFLKNKFAIQNSHITVLPELFATGFMSEAIRKYATKLEDSVIVNFLAKISRDYETAIITTVPEAYGGKIYDTAVAISEGEIIGKYRKVHLFAKFGEDRIFSCGLDFSLATIENVKIGLAICYDLRFPEIFRVESLAGAELFVIPAAWGKKRASHWRLLIRARALENQAYIIGVDRVGGSNVLAEEFAGESIVASPWGAVVAKLSSTHEEVKFVRINLVFLRKIRKEFPVLRDSKVNYYSKWYLSVSQPPPQH